MTERLNIRRMQVPERETREEMAFDPRIDMSAEDWRYVRTGEQLVDSLDESEQKWQAPAFNLHLAILAPNEPYLAKGKWNRLAPWALEFKAERNWEHFLWTIAGMKLMGYEQAHITSADRDSIQKRFEQSLTNDFSQGLSLGYAADVRIISPDQPLTIEESGRKILVSLAEDARRQGNWSSFGIHAANLRLIGENITVSKEEWKILRAELRSLRDSDAPGFVELASSMRILGAGDVSITEKGIECTPPKRYAEVHVPKMPEQPEL